MSHRVDSCCVEVITVGYATFTKSIRQFEPYLTVISPIGTMITSMHNLSALCDTYESCRTVDSYTWLLSALCDSYESNRTVISSMGKLSVLFGSHESYSTVIYMIYWTIINSYKKNNLQCHFWCIFFNKILCWLFTKKHLKFVQFRNLELILKHQGIITVSLNIQLISDCWAGYTFKILKSINITIILFLSGLKKRTET